MKPGCILVVDDDGSTLESVGSQLAAKGHEVLLGHGGEAGLSLLQSHGSVIETILLDRRMPSLDGIAFVQKMRADESLRRIPVVMLTGSDSISEIRQGLEAGVFHYLVKPVQENLLDSVLVAALREHRQRCVLRDTILLQRRAYQFMQTAKFEYTTLSEAEALASFLASFFPDAGRVLVGLAELLYNAVEHGNLGIGYTLKGQLLARGEWETEVAFRAALAENSGKKVEVVFQRKLEGTYVQITDRGQGFDWHNYLSIDPSRATHNHGRGIAQANAQCFDAVKYNPSGNQVLAMVAHGDTIQAIEW